MNALDESSPVSSLRRLPLLIRLAPELVNQFPALLPSAGNVSTGVAGILFGRVEPEFVFAQAFRPLSSFPNIPEKSGPTAEEQDWHDSIVSRSKGDAELANLTLVGWLSARKTGGLLSEDLEFHTKNFRKPTDIALLLRNEEGREFTVELHCRNLGADPSSKDYLWGTTRLPIEGKVSAPIEVPMRSKVHDDFYMRVYEFRDAEDGSTGRWRDALSKTKKVFERFKPLKSESKSGNDSQLVASGPVEPPKVREKESGSLPPNLPSSSRLSAVASAPAGIKQQNDKPVQLLDNQSAPVRPARNVVDESSQAPNLRRLPFSIRLAPQFVNSLCTVLPASDGAFEKMDGVLFGIVETEFSVLRVARLFPLGVETEDQSSVETFLAQSKKDPQTTGLSLLGWFSVRNNGGLHTEDIAFHGNNFQKPNDVILIVKSEPARELEFEIYCRTPDGFFSCDNHRSGSIRISTVSPVTLPIEIPIDGKINPDAPITHGLVAAEEERSSAGWKDAFTGKTKKALSFLQSAKPETREIKERSVAPDQGSRKSDSPLLNRLQSVTPALPFATGGGGTAAAPARVAPEKISDNELKDKQEGRPNLRLEVESARIVDSQSHEFAQQELLKQEAAKQEAAKLEAAKLEAAKLEAAKLEAAKREAAKLEAAKLEAEKLEAARQEAANQQRLNSQPAAVNPVGFVAAQPAEEEHRSDGIAAPSGSIPTPASPALADRASESAPEPGLLIRQAFSSDLSRYQPKPVRTLPWRAMAAVFAVAAVGSFGFISLKSAGANSKLPGFLQALWPSTGLDLKISTAGDRFQLSWNRTLPAVKNAREAILDIDDGSSHHQIHLGGPELANGSVLYLPTTDDVIFRLDVQGTAGQHATGSLRVIGTTRSAELQVSRPEENAADGSAAASANVAGHSPRAGVKNALQGSRMAPGGTKTLRSRNQELRTANRIPEAASAPGSSPPNAPPLPSEVPPAGKEDSGSVRQRANGTAQTSTEATKQVAESSAPSTILPAQEASRPSTSNEASTGIGAENSKPKPNGEEAAQVAESTRQSAPVQNDVVKSASAQTPPVVPVRPAPTSPGNAQATATYRPPVPVKQVLPRFNALPPGVADTVQQIKVLVRVDETGRVVEARILEGKNRVGSVLGSAALTAARQWVFEPASLHGKAISSDHTILFQFRH